MTNWNNRIVGHGVEAPDQLLAHPDNWRIHPKHQQDALKGVLDDVGWVQNILVNKTTGHVVDGHLRVALALRHDVPEVPVMYVELSEEEESLVLATLDPLSSLAVADAQKLDNLLRDIQSDDAAIQQMLADLAAANDLYLDDEPTPDPGAQIDKAEELQQKWQVQRGDLWQIGDHRLLCGDSTKAEDVARVMGGEKIELVWADPPYGVSVGDKNKYLNSIAPSNRVEENLQNDTLDEPSLIKMLENSFDNLIGFCTAGAAWYVAAPPGPLHVLFGIVLKERGIWRQTIQWVKNNSTFSPLGVDYHWRAEPIFYGWIPNARHRYYGGRKQDTVWEIARPVASPEHPTMKPVELVVRAVNNSSLRSQIVCDPFLGSGTTLVACEQTGRRGRGIEIEPKYCAVALERLQGMGLEPVKVE
jgi:DNA modification methylase